MKRTITTEHCVTHYRGKQFNGIIFSILEHFGMNQYGKYTITITEGTKYRFFGNSNGIWHIIELARVEEEKSYGLMAGSIGGVCLDAFTKIFFRPDTEKTYNITVKKVG